VQVAVISPDPYQNPPISPPTDTLLFAGADGFRHRFDATGFGALSYLWTSYATGATAVVSAMSRVAQGSFWGAGEDSVAIYPVAVSSPLTEVNLATSASRQYPVPAGYTVVALFGNAMIAGKQVNSVWTYSVLTFAADGTYTATAVTGLPSGADLAIGPRIGDDSGAVVRYVVGGIPAYGLIDLSSGHFAQIPDSSGSFAVNYWPKLTATSVAVQVSGTTVDVFSRAGLLAGSGTAPQTVTLPGALTFRVALAGDDVVGVPFSGTGPAIAVPVSGGSTAQVVAREENPADGLIQTPDGALVVGGSGVADWAVREIGTASDGSLIDTVVLPLTKMSNAGVTISQGKVWHAEATPGFGTSHLWLFGHALLPDNNFSPAETVSLYDLLLTAPLPCAPNAACVRVADGSLWGPAYLGDLGGSPPRMTLFEGQGYTGGTSYPEPGTLVDASPYYAILDVAASKTAPAKQLVLDIGYAKTVSYSIAGAGLWFDTLWRANKAGQLQATDLTTMIAAKAIGTGSNCRASDVQATGRWVYWACGTTGPAGVYDQRTRKEIRVPRGRALLGDGYILQQAPVTGSLVMYDVHADSLARPVMLATDVAPGPAADNRNITWAVDRYSGDVAYVDAGDAVHVISTGVPSTAVAIGEPTAAQLLNVFSLGNSWSQPLMLTRPVSKWTVTIRRASNGHVAHTESGGPARYGIRPSWNFRLPGGKLAYSGQYTWTLTATAAGASAATRVATFPFPVDCETPPFRSVDCDGAPALLAVKEDTSAYWYQGTSAGKLQTMGYTENWDLCALPTSGCVTALVPFGDFAGKGFADLLVRTGDGVLRAYLGIGQADFDAQSTPSIVIGKGWNRYNALVDPGFMTAGGRLELLARDRRGQLWRYAATGHGKFQRPVLVSGGWGKYTRLIGAGDLTGDGIGDLLGVDRRGVMWAYYGNGHGGFGAAHRVSSGWNRYNVILGIGDLNNDGHDDIVARDRSGKLWFLASNGRGGFARPVLLGKGWNQYAGLF
jgi:hypothetical protein